MLFSRRQILVAVAMGCLFLGLAAVFAKEQIERIVFEQQKIEGKIRRPQLVLIKADQRPVLEPIVIQSKGNVQNFVEMVDRRFLEESPFDGAFSFDDTKVKYPQP